MKRKESERERQRQNSSSYLVEEVTPQFFPFVTFTDTLFQVNVYF